MDAKGANLDRKDENLEKKSANFKQKDAILENLGVELGKNCLLQYWTRKVQDWPKKVQK